MKYPPLSAGEKNTQETQGPQHNPNHVKTNCRRRKETNHLPKQCSEGERSCKGEWSGRRDWNPDVPGRKQGPRIKRLGTEAWIPPQQIQYRHGRHCSAGFPSSKLSQKRIPPWLLVNHKQIGKTGSPHSQSESEGQIKTRKEIDQTKIPIDCEMGANRNIKWRVLIGVAIGGNRSGCQLAHRPARNPRARPGNPGRV